MTITEQFFADRDAMFQTLSQSAEVLLREALSSGLHASLLVSGGSTPEPLYRSLSALPLDWEKVDVGLVDERWVAPDHPASNEAFIRRSLLKNRAATARFIGMKNSAVSALLGQPACNEAYFDLKLPYDLTILGMGSDGHTASLFPFAEGLDTALDLDNRAFCAPIMAQPSEVTGDNLERMSLTLSALLQSRQIWLLLTGDDKREVYERAKLNDNRRAVPVSALLHQERVSVSVFWAP
ncbi:6-phosphogluconolactonase [Spongiibacter sp. KMU-166]|uniref:6-phosphogluconolactonase n=1 Tax=Spongiibacter thalassae TaxID=2721624 RepID=A0ABX1GFP5_9GAMM|nr:6-phosphogluconolactonase [Spongiibacter thalassae]NKI18032.1 6-phosphogluconolactonase [Spongiibacter thalassae]